jgi:hypothetical protein
MYLGLSQVSILRIIVGILRGFKRSLSFTCFLPAQLLAS